LKWSKWEASVEGEVFLEGRGGPEALARDLVQLRGLGVRVVVSGDDDSELVIEHGRFGVRDVEVRRFLDDVRASQAAPRRVALLEVRVGEQRFRLEHPTATGADAFLRETGAQLYQEFALAPLEGVVLVDGEELGRFADALGLGDLGERARRVIA
jgi:hypothetical protein